MAKQKENYTLTDIGFGNKVLINGRVYTYQGQDRRKVSGGVKNVYVFKMVETKNTQQEFWEKQFDVSASLKIRKIGKKDDEVKFEIY